MQIWQIILLSYFGLLLLWLIVNAVFLLVSFLAKKKVFVFLEGITAILSLLLSIATGIGDLALIVWLFQNNQVFWGIVALFLGLGIVTFAGQLLALPFVGITTAFSAWYDEII